MGVYNLNGVRANLKLGPYRPHRWIKLLVTGYISQPGRPVDEDEPAGFVISGQQLDMNNNPISSRQEVEVYNNLDADSTRAQIALINPLSNATVSPLMVGIIQMTLFKIVISLKHTGIASRRAVERG